jgi:putative salt-induced outer membrane protein
MRNAAFGLVLMVALPGVSVAEDPPPPPPPWSGEVSAGLVMTSGNSKTESSNAKGQVVYASEFWRNTFDAAALHTAQTDPATGLKSDTAERYTAGNKTDYNLTDRDYVFLSLEWQKDLFGPIRESTSETLGYGRKLLTGPAHVLDVEIGAGARQTDSQAKPDAVPPVTTVSENDTIGRGRLAYKWNFSETSNFGETVKVESGKSNTSSESVTELKVSLIGKLYALASYTVRHNSAVPTGTQKTDTITAVNLGWTFGK